MLLALDIGNSSIKWARFLSGRRVDGGRLPLDGDFGRLPQAARAAAVAVNPAALARLRRALPRLRVAGEDFQHGMFVDYRPPEACGLDRVLAVLGAMHRHPEAEAVLTLDLGTCLVGTVGVRGRGLLGGAILPGFELMARALAEGTALLPHVGWSARGPTLGRTTVESIHAGIWAALAGGARELIRGCRAEIPEPLHVVAVGSGAGALALAVPEIDSLHPFATLWGVYLAAEDGRSSQDA